MKRELLNRFTFPDGITYYRLNGKYYEDKGNGPELINDKIYRFAFMNYQLYIGFNS